MDGPDDNVARSFCKAVSLLAWHEGFRRNADSPLHIYASFASDFLGGDAGSKVSFTIRIKRADIVVLVPDEQRESVHIPPGLIVTDTKPREPIRRRRKQAQEQLASSKSVAKLKLGAKPGLKLEDTALGQDVLQDGLALDDTIYPIDVTFQQLPSDRRILPSFNVEQQDGSHLKGQVWYKDEQVRAVLRATRKYANGEDEPFVKVQVRCRRADLDPTDIILHDPSWVEKIGKLMGLPSERAKLAAVESKLRDHIIKVMLDPPDLSLPGSELILAECLVVRGD